MTFFLGIDGGGSRTRAFAVDREGHGGWGEAGPSNPNHVPEMHVRQNLQQAITSASDRLGTGLENCTSVFAGIAGITTESGRAGMRRQLTACGLNQARIGVDHDIRIALAGGLEGRPGIALIVGTGSSCYGRTSDGRSWQTGGWEALISDEGSGYYLGREAILAAARMADGRQPESALRKKVFDWLEIGSIAEVLPRIHDRGLSRAEIAAFAPQVLELAAAKDPASADILKRGAFLLAELVAANHRQLPTGPHPEVVITGGVGTVRGLYREAIEEAIRKELPKARIQDAQLPPAIGAALLAFEQAGAAVGSELLEMLRGFNI